MERKHMNTNQRADLLIRSRYMSIIQSIIAKKGKTSIFQVIVFSHIFNRNNFGKEIFATNTKKNLTELFLSLLKNEGNSFYDDIEIILSCIEMLKESALIRQTDKFLININCKNMIKDNKTFDQIISSINKRSDNYILREVLANV